MMIRLISEEGDGFMRQGRLSPNKLAACQFMFIYGLKIETKEKAKKDTQEITGL